MKFSIIIPAHNEENRIQKTLDKLVDEFYKDNKERGDYEIIVVCNGCRDNTYNIVKGYKGVKCMNFVDLDFDSLAFSQNQ